MRTAIAVLFVAVPCLLLYQINPLWCLPILAIAISNSCVACVDCCADALLAVDPNPQVAPCQFGTKTSQVQVVLSGFTNFTCGNCAVLNGTFVLDNFSPIWGQACQCGYRYAPAADICSGIGDGGAQITFQWVISNINVAQVQVGTANTLIAVYQTNTSPPENCTTKTYASLPKVSPGTTYCNAPANTGAITPL